MLPYHIERARKRWQRQTRVGTAIILLGLSACSADSSFFTWDDEKPSGDVTVSVDPLPGVSRENADALAAALRDQNSTDKLKDTQISAVLGASRKSNGLYVIAIIDQKDKSGARINRIIDEKLVQTNAAPGAAISIPQDELTRVAERAMNQLNAVPPPAQLASADTALQLKSTAESETALLPAANVQSSSPQSDDTLTTASIAPVFKINIGPAPGDGGTALTEALQKALIAQSASSRLSGEYRIDGTVRTASSETGDAAVSIEWLVSKDGRKLGAITQKNNVSPERIAGHWNEIAVSAGEAAADGVLALLDAPKPPS